MNPIISEPVASMITGVDRFCQSHCVSYVQQVINLCWQTIKKTIESYGIFGLECMRLANLAYSKGNTKIFIKYLDLKFQTRENLGLTKDCQNEK